MRRRTYLASMGGAFAGGVAGCVSAPRHADSDQPAGTPTAANTVPEGTWPQIGYDARHTHHTPDARGPRDGATIAWQSLGDRPVYPPVVDEALYLTEAWTGGTAISLAAEDGTEQWSNRELPPMRWAPALHDDRLFVLTREEGNVVRLHALDTATGDPVWIRGEGITASSGTRPAIGPTVRNGTLYIASNRGIIACDTATGDIKWTAALGPHVVETENGPTWRTDWAKPAVTADRAFTFDLNEHYRATREVYAVDRTTGGQEWTAELEIGDGWSLKGHVVAGHDRIFVSALEPHVSTLSDESEWAGTERLFALEADSGAIAWDWELPRKTLSPPAYANGTLYVGEWYPDTDTGRLHALDATDGSIDWTYRTNVGAVLSPTIAGDTIYINQGEEFAAVARSDGSLRWRLEIGARIGPPVIVGDQAYIQTNPRRNSPSQIMAIREP